MKFFTYGQNNSGGWFAGPAQYVIIQADDADDADSLAHDAGLYFNGVANGMDCDCCGDRWHSQYGDSDGSDTPMIYDTPAADFKSAFPDLVNVSTCKVFHKDGSVLTY